jgi:hypothetical protein
MPARNIPRGMSGMSIAISLYHLCYRSLHDGDFP